MRTSFLLVLLSLPLGAQDLKTPRNPAYKLVWSDEFNKNGPPDSNVWRFENGFTRNEELQWYQGRNAVCAGGALIIEARRERVANPGFGKSGPSWKSRRKFAQYTSASLISRAPHQWTYGRFEIRARFQTKPGLWPAIWTTGIGRWPHAGEIDIMEYYDHSILANVAWAGRNGKAKWDTGKHPMQRFNDPDWERKFHLWVMEWTPERIEIHLDGKLLNTTLLKGTVNETGPAKSPFIDAPQALRLNLAIGGKNGGDPSGTSFPQRYEIDYVRVYQRPAHL